MKRRRKMNELKNYKFDDETVEKEDLLKVLDSCKNFTEFFIACSELKSALNNADLRILAQAIYEYSEIYGLRTIILLAETLYADLNLPYRSIKARECTEAKMKKEILDNFDKIFPGCDHIEEEKYVKGIGKIDIYAEKNGRPIIIELKIDRKNPNQQLLSYGSNFDNPILIGITETPFDNGSKIDGIEYYTFSELKDGVNNWVS